MNARSLSIARSVAVIGGTSALVIGATLAATTTNQVSLNTTATVSDNLSISTDGTTYGPNANGGNFDIKRGVPTSAHQQFHLKTTDTSGAVKLSANVSGLGSSVDTNKSHLTAHFKKGGTEVTRTLADLATDQDISAIGDLALSSADNVIDVWITADSTTGAIGSTNNAITFNFTGTDNGTVTPPPSI